ncbi:MAG: hypothetical protein NZL85_10175 [Fimbriimonadales bacterium]|nr:hypothetical protein [Fimbriimonadales bacterium]
MREKQRDFTDEDLLLLTLVGGALMWLGGCGGAGHRAPLQADLALTSADETTNATHLRNLYTPLFDRARAMADDRAIASQPFNIQFETSMGTEILSFQLVRNHAANYPHLRVARPKTGEHANFVFGGSLSSGITLRLTNDSGELLRKNGQPVEFSLFDTRMRTRAPQDWIATGIKIAALAFLVWLGAVITRGVAAVVGFVAFNLIVLGLLAVAAGVTLPILRWFIDTSGLDWEGVRRFIEQTLETLVALLREVVDWLTSQRV